jgi:hypothetical protein
MKYQLAIAQGNCAILAFILGVHHKKGWRWGWWCSSVIWTVCVVLTLVTL